VILANNYSLDMPVEQGLPGRCTKQKKCARPIAILWTCLPCLFTINVIVISFVR